MKNSTRSLADKQSPNIFFSFAEDTITKYLFRFYFAEDTLL
jgi:hypothetical protein